MKKNAKVKTIDQTLIDEEIARILPGKPSKSILGSAAGPDMNRFARMSTTSRSNFDASNQKVYLEFANNRKKASILFTCHVQVALGESIRTLSNAFSRLSALRLSFCSTSFASTHRHFADSSGSNSRRASIFRLGTSSKRLGVVPLGSAGRAGGRNRRSANDNEIAGRSNQRHRAGDGHEERRARRLLPDASADLVRGRSNGISQIESPVDRRRETVVVQDDRSLPARNASPVGKNRRCARSSRFSCDRHGQTNPEHRRRVRQHVSGEFLRLAVADDEATKVCRRNVRRATPRIGRKTIRNSLKRP